MNDKRLTQPRLAPAVLAAFLFCLTAFCTASAIAEEQVPGQILIKSKGEGQVLPLAKAGVRSCLLPLSPDAQYG